MQSDMVMHAARVLEQGHSSISLGLVDGRLHLPAFKIHPVQAHATDIVYHMQDACAYTLITGATPSMLLGHVQHGAVQNHTALQILVFSQQQ